MNYFDNVRNGQNWQPEPYQRYNAVNELLSQFGATGAGSGARVTTDRTIFDAVNRDAETIDEGLAVEAASAEMEEDAIVPVKLCRAGTSTLWGVTLAALEPGDIGSVLLSGVVTVQLAAALPAGTQYVEPGEGGRFKAASGGRAQVIATQEKTALILLGGGGNTKEEYNFQITAVTREETGEDGEKKTTTSVMVLNGSSGDNYAGTVRLGDGSRRMVPEYETSNSETLKYLYLVMDVTHDPPIYILEHESETLSSVLGGIVPIGSYRLRDNVPEIRQVLRQTVPVELGPSYLGPYCLLPGPPDTGGGYTFVLNPLNGLTPGANTYYVNGIDALSLVEPQVFSGCRTADIRLWAGLKAPKYEIGATAPTTPGSLSIMTSEPPAASFDAVMEITGNSSGILNIWWTSSTSDTIAGLLFREQMDT